MAYRDDVTSLSSAQAVVDNTASEDVLDFEQANPDTGEGCEVRMTVTASIVFNAATEYILEVQDSADDSSFAVIARSLALVAADLVDGSVVRVPLPSKYKGPDTGGIRRYLRGYHNPDGSITSGTVDIDVVPIGA